MSGPAAGAVPGHVGRYTIRGVLGRGGMGVVYEGHDPLLGRAVAIKQVHAGAGDVGVARLQREAGLVAGLSHPGIIGIHEVGSAHDAEGRSSPFIVMDLLPGGDLGEFLALTRERRLAIFRQVVDAVAHAHARGVVHRDLKPSNILLDGRGQPVVTDFGLARADDTATRLTATGALVGTPQYMAPEQVLGQACDARADVWALGVILHELLADLRPFDAPSAAELYEAILRQAPRDPADAPAALAAICRTALAKDPDERYPDAGALAADLARWQAGEALAGQHTAIGRRVRRWLGHRPWAAVATAAIIVAIAVVTPPALRRRDRQRRFDALLAGARSAHAAGDWAAARAGAEGALALRADAGARALAADSTRRLSAQAAAAARDDAARRHATDLRRTLDAIARLGADLEAASYLPDTNGYTRLRDELAARLARLQERAREPACATVAALWTELGVGWRRVGRVDRARTALERALTLAPDDGRAAFHLGSLLIRRSLVLLQSAVALAPEHFRAQARVLASQGARVLRARRSGWSGARPLDRHLAQATLALAEERTGDVRRLCDAGQETFAGQLGSEQLWGLAGCTGSRADAARAWTRVLERRPQDGFAWFMRGSLRQQLGEPAGAVRDLDRAIAIDPHLLLAFNNRGVARGMCNDYIGAVADFDHELQRDASLWMVLGNRGIALTSLGKLDAALRDLDRALVLRPGELSLRYNRGRTRRQRGRSGDLGGALRDFDAVLASRPDDVEALIERGRLRLRMRDAPGAAADIDRAGRLAPRNSTVAMLEGRLLAARGDRAGAMRAFDRAVTLAPRNYKAYTNRGTLKAQGGDYRGAIADFERTLALAPKSVEALANRGTARMVTRDYAGALADFDRAIALEPDRPNLHMLRGQLHLGQGRHALARADLEQMTRKQPRNWVGWFLLGQVLVRQGQRDAARRALRESARLAPPGARPQVTRALEALGG